MPDIATGQETVPPLFASASKPRRRRRAHTPTNEAAGVAAREAAISRASKGSPPVWADGALRAVKLCCEGTPSFITDAVWEYIDDKPPEPRALGAVMRRAEAIGYCSKTDRFRPTAIVSSHRGPRRVWKSNIYEGAI